MQSTEIIDKYMNDAILKVVNNRGFNNIKDYIYTFKSGIDILIDYYGCCDNLDDYYDYGDTKNLNLEYDCLDRSKFYDEIKDQEYSRYRIFESGKYDHICSMYDRKYNEIFEYLIINKYYFEKKNYDELKNLLYRQKLDKDKCIRKEFVIMNNPYSYSYILDFDNTYSNYGSIINYYLLEVILNLQLPISTKQFKTKFKRIFTKKFLKGLRPYLKKTTMYSIYLDKNIKVYIFDKTLNILDLRDLYPTSEYSSDEELSSDDDF